MDEIRNNLSFMYNHLEVHKCLCKIASEKNPTDVWYQMYQKSFQKNDASGADETRLLCINFLRLTGEIYINMTLKHQSVCNHIQQLFEMFSSDELWTFFVNHLRFSKDKFLVYTLIKAFSVLLSTSCESVFILRIEMLLNNLKDNLIRISSANILDFLSNLVNYEFKACDNDLDVSSCHNVCPSTVCHLPDLFQSLCTVLSPYWISFMKQFHEVISSKYESLNIVCFLMLWQKLVLKLSGQDLFHNYLNEDSVVAFLSYSHNLDVVSLRIYSDIIMQFSVSSLNCTSSQGNDDFSVEEAVAAALEISFFNLLPCDTQLSGLCISTSSKLKESASQSPPERFQKCDAVIVKKIAFIFLSLTTEFKKEDLMCKVIMEVSHFVKQNFEIPSEEPVYIWINNVFIDQDDILLGVMFALLRIYITFKRSNGTKDFPKRIEFQNILNPHKVFIGFLQKLGFDYNELLAFLTSDETCFLPYVMQYLKLLHQEWELFIKAHSDLIKVTTDEFDSICTNEEKLLENTHTSPVKKLLVSYSSSSSEDETSFVVQEDKIRPVFYPNNLIAVITLMKLKDAIKKLVDASEFPYNISPLLTLLHTCESHCFSQSCI